MIPNWYSVCYTSDMTLTAWARHAGIHPQTARRWVQRGGLPLPPRQRSTGTLLVDAQPATNGPTAARYAHGSSWAQNADLDRQLGRLSTWAGRQQLAGVRTEAEVRSGLNGRRRRLMRLLAGPTLSPIGVEQRDRWARFGVEDRDAARRAQGRRGVVAEPGAPTDDLVRDRVEVFTAVGARRYGRRSARTRALRAVTATRAAPQRRSRRRLTPPGGLRR